MPKVYNNKIDIIIPAYNVPDEILFRCLASIACQDIVKDIEVTIVDDASTKQNYTKVAKMFSRFVKINVLRYEVNGGPGVARQYGIDHTSNGFLVFIDADDTFNGAFALKALRTGINLEGSKYQMCVAVFDEILEHNLPNNEPGPVLIDHTNDIVWMFGKIYRRSFIDKYKIRFHETSRANEDNGFNAICNLLLEEEQLIRFIPAHVYYWHENLNSITRINDGQYTYGGSERDSTYGYVENMIYALRTVQKIKPDCKGFLNFVLNGMTWLYQHYIECYHREPKSLEANMKWYARFYKEAYSLYEKNITQQQRIEAYNRVMTQAYTTGAFFDLIPHKTYDEFLEECKQNA